MNFNKFTAVPAPLCILQSPYSNIRVLYRSIALQELFIKAFRAYDAYTEEGKEHAWLKKIAQKH